MQTEPYIDWRGLESAPDNPEPRGLARLDAAGLAALSEILADVMDSVRYWDISECVRYNGKGRIEYVTEADANANRLDFIAEVRRRIIQRAAPATTAKGERQ